MVSACILHLVNIKGEKNIYYLQKTEFAMKGDKMPKCELCGSESDNLKNWGQMGMICPSCVKKTHDKFPEKPPEKESEVEIAEPKFYSAGSYNPKTGNVLIRDVAQFCLYETINHEFIHYIIHKLEGLRATYQVDSLDYIIDPYHSLN